MQTENDGTLVARVAEWLPGHIMGDSLEAQALYSALADAQDGTSYIADLTENGEPAMKALLERLSTQEAKALSSRELTPVDAANDLITRVWIDYLKKQRDGLDLAKPDECRRRFELSATIKALESTHDWDRRANIIYPEFERLAQAADTVSVEPQQ